jgi:hypothetical protein
LARRDKTRKDTFLDIHWLRFGSVVIIKIKHRCQELI